MKNAVHQYEDKLLEFAYGELPRHEADAVDAHVRGCVRCTEALGEIRGVRATMAQLPMQAAPDAGLESLLAYAEQAASRNAQTKKAKRPLWRRLFAPLGTVMALLTVGVVALRANEGFDTTTAAALAEQKVEKRRDVESKSFAPEPSAVPVAAAPADQLAKNEDPAADLQEKAAFGGEGDVEGGLLDAKEQNRKDVAPAETRNAPARGSQAIRSKSAPEPKRDELQQDYSNAMSSGERLKSNKALADKAVEQEAAPRTDKPDAPKAPPPAPPAQAQREMPGEGASNKGSSGYGVGSIGGVTGSSSSLGGGAKPVLESAKKEAPAPVAATTPSATPAPEASTSAKQGKSSYELSPLSGPRGRTSASDDLDNAPSVQAVGDGKYYDDEARFRDRQQSETRTTALKNARAAADRGDVRGEVNLLLNVYKSNPTGMDKVETLRGLCNGLQALGEEQQADAFCDQLLREFPQSMAARELSQRRNMMQRAVMPAPKAAERAEEAPSKATKKPLPSKAKSAPSNASDAD